MKIKKFLFCILIFLVFLLLDNYSDAFILYDKGEAKFYLEDLPFSEEYYDTVYLYNSSKNTITVFGVWRGCYLGFDMPNNSFYHINEDGSNNNLMRLYVCSLDTSTDRLIGGTWNNAIVSGDDGASIVYFSDYLDYQYIGGTANIYPCTEGKIIKSLPVVGGLSWKSPFFITLYNKGDYTCKILIPEYFNDTISFYTPRCSTL